MGGNSNPVFNRGYQGFRISISSGRKFRIFKQLNRTVWAFDVEWVQNPDAGRGLLQLPEDKQEAVILSIFLNGIGDKKPQFVGFNSQCADLKILVQRAMVKGLQAKGF